eukprot:1800624-Rhodomonas_salina.1
MSGRRTSRRGASGTRTITADAAAQPRSPHAPTPSKHTHTCVRAGEGRGGGERRGEEVWGVSIGADGVHTRMHTGVHTGMHTGVHTGMHT